MRLLGDAPLCALYLAAAGVARVATGPGGAGEDDLVVDLAEGRPDPRAAVVGRASGREVRIGGELEGPEPPTVAARALVECLAAAEALLRLAGGPPRAYRSAAP